MRGAENVVPVLAHVVYMPVSCAVCFSDGCCGEYSSLIPVSLIFSLISTQHFLTCFLSRSDPVYVTLLISLWI